MTSIAGIENTFLAWVTSLVDPDVEVIFQDQAYPRADGLYVTIKLITGTQRVGGHDEVRASGDFVQVSGFREGTVNIQAYRQGARQLCVDLSDSLDRPTIAEMFASQNIAVIEPLPIQNLTTLIDQDFEERGSFDVRFRTAFNLLDNPGTIVTVVESATIDDINLTSTIST